MWLPVVVVVVVVVATTPALLADQDVLQPVAGSPRSARTGTCDGRLFCFTLDVLVCLSAWLSLILSVAVRRRLLPAIRMCVV